MKKLTAKEVTPVAKPKVRSSRAIELVKKPLTEKQQLLVAREVTAMLGTLSEKNIKEALYTAAQQNPTVLSALTRKNTTDNVQEPKPEIMPWRALVDVFVNNRYFAEERARISMMRDPAMIMREFRTLTIGGCRQTGKTQLARDIVRENSKARLIHAPYPNLIPKETDLTVKDRTISDIDSLTLDHLQDVELLVINQDGFPLNRNNPYQSLLDCLAEDANSYPAGLQVIWIL